MSITITPKMQNFIAGYERFKNEGTEKLKELFTLKEKAAVKKLGNGYVYLSDFANLKAVNFKLYYSKYGSYTRAVLVREFETLNVVDECMNVADGKYKIFALSRLKGIFASEEKFKTNISFDYCTNLVILTKYGVFDIGSYLQGLNINSVMKEIFKGKELSILPSEESGFYIDCQNEISKYLVDPKNRCFDNNTKISFKYEFMGFGRKKSISNVYVDDQLLFKYPFERSMRILAKYKLNDSQNIEFFTNVAECDFSIMGIDEVLKRCLFTTAYDIDIYQFDILTEKTSNLSSEYIYTKLLKEYYSGLVNLPFNGYSNINDILNLPSLRETDPMFEEIEDKGSFLNKIYISYLGLSSFTNEQMGYTVYMYDVNDFDMKSQGINMRFRNHILFVEDLINEDSDIIVLSTYELLKQVYTFCRLGCKLSLPFFFFDLINIGFGNIAELSDTIFTNNIGATQPFERKAFNYINEKIKDTKVKIKADSREVTLGSDFIKTLFKNNNEITFEPIKEEFVGFHDISTFSFYIGDKLIEKQPSDFIQREITAKVGDDVVAVLRYIDDKFEKTFEELGMSKETLGSYIISDPKVIEKLRQI